MQWDIYCQGGWVTLHSCLKGNYSVSVVWQQTGPVERYSSWNGTYIIEIKEKRGYWSGIPCPIHLLIPDSDISSEQHAWCRVQFSCSVGSNSVTPWSVAHQASLSITNTWSLPKLMSIQSVMPSNHLLLCCPLLLPPSIFPSIRVFSNESVLCIRWPEYWCFSFNISTSNEYSKLISFRMDWLDLLAVQGTLKSLLQPHSSKASILQHSDFFIVQLSHPYMTTGKTIALTRWTLVDKVMSLLFNMLSRFLITFLPRSKHLAQA